MFGLFNFSTESLMQLLLTVPIMLLALPIHEMAHGWAAYKLGDPTARNLGRLTLNPLKHLDPIGALCMLVFRFGWAKPVPVSSRNFKKPRRDMALTALAGPVSNLLLAFLGVLLYNIALFIIIKIDPTSARGISIADTTLLFFYLFAFYNINLALFNLIPVPPLDGSRIFYIFLPPKWYFGIMKYERYIALALMVLLYFGIISIPLQSLSLAIMNGMDFIVNLIPIF